MIGLTNLKTWYYWLYFLQKGRGRARVRRPGYSERGGLKKLLSLFTKVGRGEKHHIREHESIMRSLSISIFSANPNTAGNSPALENTCRLLRGLARVGHALTFYHPDSLGRRTLWENSDDPRIRTVNYPTHGYVNLFECLEEAAKSDVILKISGQGHYDQLLDRAILEVRKPGGIVAIVDLEPQATLNRLCQDANDCLIGLIPEYDLILTTGGLPLVSAFLALGARGCQLLWSSLDPVTRQITPPDANAAAPGSQQNASLDQVTALEYAFGRALAARGGNRAEVPAPMASAT
jgi:hypothetical protein